MKKLCTKALALILVGLFVILGANFSVLAENTVDTGEDLSAINIGISGKISLMFYFKDLDAVSGFKVTAPTIDGSDNVTVVDKSELQYDSNENRYLLTVRLAAVHQADLVTVRAIGTSGAESSTAYQYSVTQYASELFELAAANPDNTTYAAAAEAIKTVLNYGAMAQAYFNYKTESLANNGLYYRGKNPITDMMYEDIYGASAPRFSSTEGNTIKITRVIARLDDCTSLRFYFEYNGTACAPEGLSVKLDGIARDGQIFRDKNGEYYVLINNISPTGFNHQYRVEISDGTELCGSAEYSVINYLQSVLASPTVDEELNNVAFSMFQAYVRVCEYAHKEIAGHSEFVSACSHSRTYIDAILGGTAICADCFSNLGPADSFSLDASSSTVTTNEGLTYTANGFTSANEETGLRVPAGKALTLTGSQLTSSADTNRFHLRYYSSVPLRLTMTYSYLVDGNTCTAHEIYYMEAGENLFSAVEYSFLASLGKGPKRDKLDYYGGIAEFALQSITIESLVEGDYDFVLFSYRTESVHPKPTQVNYNGKSCYIAYIKNDRYKLGVNLTWGGAVSELYPIYLEGELGEISSSTNLINASDTGRLIQQSYYGTNGEGEPQYTPHYWKSREDLPYAKWRYNPVQGGDANNNQSRIIDFEIGDDYIYVKAQPLDWANHENRPAEGGFVKVESRHTFCYVENRFTLKGNYIQADNRLVDFSGYTHPYVLQELPACFTLAYLDDYYWYNGTNPWEDDALTREDNLGFWGDPLKYKETSFEFEQSNTETWGAFVNQSSQFGIGIYTPNADLITAGRLDGSEESMSSSALSGYTSYLGPMKLLRIVCYEPIEYSYLVCADTIDNIRKTFAENKDFATNYSLNKYAAPLKIPDEIDLSYIDFSDERNVSLIRNVNNTVVSYDASVGAAKLSVTGSNPYFHLNYMLYDNTVYNADSYSSIEIEYMIPTKAQQTKHEALLYYCVGSVRNPDGRYSYSPITLTADGNFHTVSISTSLLGANWKGSLNQLRLDFLRNGLNGDVFYIKSVSLTTSGTPDPDPNVKPEPPVEKISWHASVDLFQYQTNTAGNKASIDLASTNSTIGTAMANASGIHSAITATSIWYGAGWLAFDGYAVESFNCKVFSYDGTLLKSTSCALFTAESDVLDHVSKNMHYSSATVPVRLNGNSDTVSLSEYAGQTVTVIYEAALEGTDQTVEVIRIYITVPTT